MFKWLRDSVEHKIVQSHLSEMMPYLRELSSTSDEGVAHVYLVALSYRNVYKKTSGIDLFNTQDALEKNKALALHIGSGIRDFQKSALHVSAAGLKVWLFTIRSVMHDELRPVGTALWHQLIRGFPHVRAIADEVYQTTGTKNDITDLGMVPVGFEPVLSSQRS